MELKYKIGYIPICYTDMIKDAEEAEDIMRKMLATSIYKEMIKIPYITWNKYDEGEDDGK